MQFLKHQHDDNMDWMGAKGKLNVDRATAEFVQTATGTDFEINEDDEAIDMCKAWKILWIMPKLKVLLPMKTSSHIS